MAIITLELRHYRNPESFFKEFMAVINLKDQDLCQKQEEIKDLKKKISDLEEELAEKETEKKCYSSIIVQTDEEEVSKNSSSRIPSSHTDEFHTNTEESHSEEASATDDTRFVKSSTDKPKGKQNRKVSKKSAFKSSSVPKTPSVAKKMPKTPLVPKTSESPTNFIAQDFRSSVCPRSINSFKHKSS